LKTYTTDFLPQERNKYHMFSKMEFQAPSSETPTLRIRVDIPGDRYLLNYLRLVLVDRNAAGKIT